MEMLYMTANELQRLRKINTAKIRFTIMNALHGAPWLSFFSAAYIIAKTNGTKTADFDSFLDEYKVKPQLSPVIFNTVGDKWDLINELSNNCSSDECKALLLFEEANARISHYDETPSWLSVLSAKAMNISSGEGIADLCTGMISFIRECVALGLECDYLGSEIDDSIRYIAMMRADILGGSINLTSEDSLKLNGKFDKIFCHGVFGVKWKYYYPECGHSASADWLFAEKCLELLKTEGKAVCLMANGSMLNLRDRFMREKFILSGYIETIIALPANILNSSAISIALIVLSKGNNKQVNFVDATGIFTSCRRKKQLSEENIQEILSAIGKDSPISRVVRYEEIVENNFDLYPKNYTDMPVKIANAVCFSEVIKRITRGSQVKASELDSLMSEKETNTRLLMLSDMNTGIISNDLPFLKELDKRYDKYCAKDKSIILTKNGYPVKTAVANISADTKMLVNGNLYIIELDEEKVDPYYLKAYFDSEHGQSQLKSILVGITIPNIPIEALKKLQIPMCPISEQKTIAENYIIKQQRVIKLRQELKEAENELSRFF